MRDRIFLDTNIFVYTFYEKGFPKRKRATTLLTQLLEEDNCVISYQVVQELINVLRKQQYDFYSSELFSHYLNKTIFPCCDVFPSKQLYSEAIEISLRWKFSFYDSLIIASALEADCSILYSEDLQHQQKIYSLEIINPFLTD